MRDLVRTSRKVVFVAMPNRVKVGYLLHKYLPERDFVHHVDEHWAHLSTQPGALSAFRRFLWAAFLESGIHTGVTAVILALTIPVRSKGPDRDAPLNRLEHQLAPWVNFFILPVFALSNAGISFQQVSLSAALQTSITTGILFGLVVGKPLGIMAVSYLAVLLRAAHLPQGVTWRHLTGASFLGGIGFTTSIFLASLAFAGGIQFDQSKIGILTASLVAGWLGVLILWKVTKGTAAPKP